MEPAGDPRPGWALPRLRIGSVAPPWVPVPSPAYGGIEEVVALQARGLAAGGHRVTLVAAPGSRVEGVEVVSPLDELPAMIGASSEEWRHVLPGLEAVEDRDVVIGPRGPLTGDAGRPVRRDERCTWCTARSTARCCRSAERFSAAARTAAYERVIAAALRPRRRRRAAAGPRRAGRRRWAMTA